MTLHENVPGGGSASTVETYTLAEGDLSDIGARPGRVVRARLVSISTL